MKKTILSLAFCVAISGTALAGPSGGWGKVSYDKSPPPPPPAPLCFEAGEFTVDGFFGGAYGQNTQVGGIGDGYGGGIGFNYFLTEMFGLTARYFAFDNDAPGSGVEHDVSFSGVLRFPIQDACIAPYIMGGGGVIANGSNEGTAHIGGGLDWRFAETMGLFADGRYTWVGGDKNDFASFNVGIRVKF